MRQGVVIYLFLVFTFNILLVNAGVVTALTFRNLKQITIKESMGVGITRCIARFDRDCTALVCLAIDWIMTQWSLAVVIDVGQRTFTDQVYTDDDAALFTSDAANCPYALITFDSAAATVALHTSLVKTKVQNRL